jgi:hypothetical protein
LNERGAAWRSENSVFREASGQAVSGQVTHCSAGFIICTKTPDNFVVLMQMVSGYIADHLSVHAQASIRTRPIPARIAF